MSKIILAIDPGSKGGYALKHSDNELVATGQLPEGDGAICEWLGELKSQADAVELTIEKVRSHTNNIAMASAMANLYGGKRFIEGYAMGIGFRVVNVEPKKWQKHFGFGAKRKVTKLRRGKQVEENDEVEWKNRLKSEARRRFPSMKVTLENADALLILEWALANQSLV